jgi:molybdate-binding protein
VLLCGYKSTVKLLFTPVDRGVGIEASAHTTVVDVVDVVDEVVDVVVEEDVVVVEQVELAGAVVSTADAGAIRYDPKNSCDMTVNIATKRIFFMNTIIAMFMK